MTIHNHFRTIFQNPTSRPVCTLEIQESYATLRSNSPGRNPVFRYPADRLPVSLILSLTLLDFIVYFTVDSIWLLLSYFVLTIVPKGCICAWNHHHQHTKTFQLDAVKPDSGNQLRTAHRCHNEPMAAASCLWASSPLSGPDHR